MTVTRLLLLFVLLSACTVPAPRRPNIVILYTDDQGYGDCSALNPDARFRTPNMDRIARAGMVFTDGHSADSVCTPSRYALLTGRYAWRSHRGARVVGADTDCLIKNGQTTIASYLREQGYNTALFGKWHLGLQIPGTKGARDWSLPVSDGPLQKGFDVFYGLPASMNYGVLTWFDGDLAVEAPTMWTRKKFPEAEITTRPLDYRMAPPFDAERRRRQDLEVAPGFADVHALRIITERSVDYIERRQEQPFFLYVAFTSPHLPHCTAPEFRGTSGMGNYGDFMNETDHRIGQILDALDRAGLSENTLLVLSSDNGPENNYKDWERIYKHRSAGGLRGGKRDLYEGGHRVPFMVRWPNVVAAGSRSARSVGQVDLLATIADTIGQPLRPASAPDSHSFFADLGGNASKPRPPLIQHSSGRFAIRDGRWKLHFARPARRGERSGNAPTLGEPVELFDLDQDLAERNNVLAEHPRVVERLHRRARELMRRGSRVDADSAKATTRGV